jgi:hypothetical protein
MSEVDARDGARLRGRFALFGDGSMLGWHVAYATGLCDRCQNCDCGTQQEPIATGEIVKDMMRSPLKAGQAFKAFISHDLPEGDTDDG